MDKSSIEQKIKDRLINHEESIDNEYLFKELGIEEKSSKRRFFLLLFVGIGLGIGILGTLGYFYTINNDATTQVIEEKKPTHTKQVINEVSIISKHQSTAINTQKSIQTSDATVLYAEESNIVETKSTVNLITQFEENIQKNTQHTNSISEYSDPVINKVNTNAPDVSSSLGNLEEDKEFKLSDDFSNSYISLQKEARIKDIKNVTIENKSQEILKELTLSKALFDPFNVEKQLLKPKISSLPPPPLNDTITPVSKKTKWNIMTYVSYDVFKQSKITADPRQFEYSSARKASEIELEAISAGLMANYSIDEHWYVGAGVEYMQYNSQFNYSEFIGNDTQDSSLVLSINYLGDSTIIKGSFFERKWNAFNELRIINIPLVFGYTYDYKKVSAFVELGMQVGIYSDFKGKLYSESFFILENPSYYKNVNLSTEIGIGLSYKLSNRSALYGKVRYRRFLDEISSGTNPLDEHIWQAGTVVGYQFLF